MDLKHILDRMGFAAEALAGERALVTGAAMGIGRQTARALALLGARVAIVDRDAALAAETADQIVRDGGEAMVVTADIAAEGQFLTAIDKVRNRWQGVDILVNNAAKAFIGSYVEETPEIWDQVFDTNLRYPAQAIKNVLPAMLESEHGIIANVISLEGLAFSSAYSATKVGMRSLTSSLANEIAMKPGSGSSPSPRESSTRPW